MDNYGDKVPFLGITQKPCYSENSNIIWISKVGWRSRRSSATNWTAGAIITRGIDNCLFVFANNEWEILAKKLVALPLAQANSRAFARLMLAGATDVELDNQGRILDP